MRRERKVWCLGWACVVLTAGCAGTAGSAPAARTTADVAPDAPEGWPAAYDAAIDDARNPEPDEVAYDLTAIRRDNESLVWRDWQGVEHVLMVSLVGDSSRYHGRAGAPYHTGDHAIWVTAAPELQQRCRTPDFDRGDLDRRLREVLGLTPTAPVEAFVEFWVPSARLFRPAPDNEITDRTAGLALPADVEPWYREWFNDLRAAQYFQSSDPPHDAYPWTQLGYTYDWGDPGTDRGLSEFVIRTGSTVMVEAVHSTDAYCGRSGG